MRYYLGIDGGGTRTTACLCDQEGRVLCRAQAGGSNFYADGFNKARAELRTVVQEVRQALGRDVLSCAFIGSSAIEYEADETLVRRLCDGVLECPVFMHSDVYIALMAHAAGRLPACMLISGTGSCAAAAGRDGAVRHWGGWGHLLGDDGSAYGIALAGLRAAVRAFDGLAPQTALCAAAVDEYALNTPRDLIDRLSPRAAKADIARFAQRVDQCAKQGDEAARAILLEAGNSLARLAAVCLRESGCRQIGLYGSVLTCNQAVRGQFDQELDVLLPGARGRPLALPPEAGALLAAIARFGADPAEPAAAALSAYFHRQGE